MAISSKRPILVTGPHRSGSTWVGKMIASSPDVEYIHEPFNIDPRSGICGGQFDNWFAYVCETNSSAYYDYLRQCFNFKYPLASKIAKNRDPKSMMGALRDYGNFTFKRMLHKRPLVKDPIAVFSTEWLAQTFNMDVIILIRHPAAFAGSIKQANWSHPFHHFLNQPMLMRDHLSEFAAEIEAFSVREQDIVDQAILLWNIIHSTIRRYKKDHKEWYFVRHEDISRNPVEEFRALFQKVNLAYSRAVQNKIVKFSQSRNSSKIDDLLSIERDSVANIWSWKNRLTTEEIDRVREGTKYISSSFYDEGHW